MPAARRQEALEEVQKEARALGVGTLVMPTDTSDSTQVKALVHASLGRFGKIDVFVADAGMYFRCPVRDLAVEHSEHVMAVSFYGRLHSLVEVPPHMIARRSGHIVVVSTCRRSSRDASIPP